MANPVVPSAAKPIQLEEVLGAAGACPPISEATLYKIAGSLHSILDAKEMIAVGEVFESEDAPAGGDNHHPVLGAGYVLCMGQSVAAGLSLHDKFGVDTLPDLRGIFARGKKNGRAPDAIVSASVPETDLGGDQSDDYPEHAHEYVFLPNTSPVFPFGPIALACTDGQLLNDSGGGQLDTVGAATAANFHIVISNFGGAENRPANVTNYVYVRIN